MNTKSKILVWDWPIRVFHLLFALTLTCALGLALLGEDTGLFRWHMFFGILAGFLLLLRLFLGLVGSTHYSYRDMLSSLRDLVPYVRGLFGKNLSFYAGHNPLAWLVYILMFICLFLTVFTGINMHNEVAEEVHSVFAWMLLGTIVMHLAGLGIHTFRTREMIALSMIDGKKVAKTESVGAKERKILAVAVLLIALLFGGQLFTNFKSGNDQVLIPWIGKTVNLGEWEGKESKKEEFEGRLHSGGREGKEHEKEHKHHDDHHGD